MPHPDPLPAFVQRATGTLACLAGLGSLSACGPSDPAAIRAAEVEAILATHVEHEEALLGILEKHRREPLEAEAELASYLAANGQAMSDLCAKRRQLEADPTALATAMRELTPVMSRVFERRRALAETAPELMARENVRAALATLDDL